MDFMAAGLAGGSDIPAGYDVGKLSAQDILGRSDNRDRFYLAPSPGSPALIHYSPGNNLADISLLGAVLRFMGALSPGFV